MVVAHWTTEQEVPDLNLTFIICVVFLKQENLTSMDHLTHVKIGTALPGKHSAVV